MGLENIVRPAQAPDTAPVKTVNNRRTVQNWQPIQLKWGGNGSVTQASGSESYTFTVYQIQRPTEKKNP